MVWGSYSHVQNGLSIIIHVHVNINVASKLQDGTKYN